MEDYSLPELVSRYVNTTNCNLFLTGKAGTGKTTLLRSLRENTHKNVLVCAPTGIAAINAGGVTVHSLFQLPFGAFIPDEQLELPENVTTVAHINTSKSLFKGFKMNSKKRDILRSMELLVIDEVSMLRADMLDAIDRVLRHVRIRKDLPFGGAQVLFIGDMLQLPPVIKQDEWMYLRNYYQNGYFFNAQVLRQFPPVHVELQKVYRQSDPVFVDILNHFRENKVTTNDVKVLNTHYDADFEQSSDDGYIHLTTHNKTADEKNQKWLKELKTKEFTYSADIEGDFPEHQYPNAEHLKIKEGAQVMFIKNDYSGESKYFNGKIGKVTQCDSKDVWVKFDDGTPEFKVEDYEWENKKYVLNKATGEVEEQLIGRFIQYPIKLAWAITVHKSQGLTFEKAILDVGKAFAPGQVYVALSRLTSLDGLVLSTPINERGVPIDATLSHFTKSSMSIEQLTPHLQQEAHTFIYNTLLSAFNLSFLVQHLEEHLMTYDKTENLSSKQRFKPWGKEILEQVRTLKKVGDGFRNQVASILSKQEEGYIDFLYERTQKAQQYFDAELKKVHKNATDHLEDLKGERFVLGYTAEVKDIAARVYATAQKMIRGEKLVESYIKKSDLKKDEIGKPSFKTDHIKEEKISLTAKPKSEEKKKYSPQTTAYVLFRQGKEPIAIAREMGVSRVKVETFLAKYIAQGRIDVKELVDSKNQNKIKKVIESLQTKSITTIKKQVKGVTDTDIRYVLAALEAQYI
ncbi:AAA family ATPase [Flammeovirga yaeyamensis]|uniref:AAA family ATPase n=1 Tax=Flammeovirga yaeyamensis TaxID=367791 RepID=A0AAX1N1M6_9BACT|nr:AAA family ATPase [Flammeovirga yaeyamensis]MBB3698260.1 antitoxin component of RelBE/YafQ-DinJ toxin-antitoxin module/DNA-binding transcriptional MerR regulator [Flammeovirga yaeyamensis]NMF34385.1 AAA family ATPase [Flammeovirga yaeyamensis]QWG01366.1 AAA family ATPase [Flammeovirga yaeyamensis]